MNEVGRYSRNISFRVTSSRLKDSNRLSRPEDGLSLCLLQKGPHSPCASEPERAGSNSAPLYQPSYAIRRRVRGEDMLQTEKRHCLTQMSRYQAARESALRQERGKTL
jgi:hypothetical protein